jgi:hypothetical protein
MEGSIFQWANEGRPLEKEGKPVETVHPYNAKQYDIARWVKADAVNLKELLVPYPTDHMRMWEISSQLTAQMMIHPSGNPFIQSRQNPSIIIG